MVLSAQIRNESGESVGTFALKPWPFESKAMVWFGEVDLEIGGDRFRAQCQLVKIGEPEELVREGEWAD